MQTDKTYYVLAFVGVLGKLYAAVVSCEWVCGGQETNSTMVRKIIAVQRDFLSY